MSDWLPIEEAPKDGTRVLLKSPGNRQWVGSYEENKPFFGSGWHLQIPCLGGWGIDNAYVVHWEEDLPTHFKFLEE